MIERLFALSVLLVFVATFSRWGGIGFRARNVLCQFFGWQRGFKDASTVEAPKAQSERTEA